MHTLLFQRAFATKPMEESSSLMHLGLLINLTSFVAFEDTFGPPVIQTPIPAIQEARAVKNMIDCQIIW